MKRRSTIFLFFLVMLFVSARYGFAEDKVFRVSDGKIITYEQMVDDLKKVSVVFVGEVHDDTDHHRAELDIIRSLHESDRPVAIGLEMFRAESQDVLDSWTAGKLSLDRFLPLYYDNWRMPWPLYSNIFLYARDNKLSLRGLNIPDAISKKIGQQGFSSLTSEEKKQLPPGISCNVDPAYMDFIRKAYAGHHGKDREFVNFCEAQMVWDKSMAWHITGYLKKNPDKTLVVLAGIGHAWKRGISEQFEPEVKPSYRVVLPVIPDRLDRESATTRDADYVLLE